MRRRIYYHERSTRYHFDKTCWTLNRGRPGFERTEVTFHRDATVSNGEGVPMPITNPMGHSATDRLVPCRVCVLGTWEPSGGVQPTLHFGKGAPRRVEPRTR